MAKRLHAPIAVDAGAKNLTRPRRLLLEGIISMEDMESIYDVTDVLGIDRESINVELGKEDPGSWKIASGGLLNKTVIEITVPLTGDLDEWLITLREGLEELIKNSNS